MPPFARRIAAIAVVLLVVPAAAAGAVESPHVHSADDAALSVEPLGTHRTGLFDVSAAEIVTFHPATQRTFVVNAESGTVDVLDASDPGDPTLETSLQMAGSSAADGSTIPTGAVANSVAIRDDGLAVVAVESDVKTDAGWLAFLDAGSLDVLGAVRVGALPDMVTVTPDGTRAVVAHEGEPADDFSIDPEGSVGVVELPDAVAASEQESVRTADFRAWDPDGDRTLHEDVRVFGPVLDEGRRVSTNLEPEYVAVDPAGDVAYVALQEANAVAVVHLDSATVTDIWPLGRKDHSQPGQGLDPSDRDDAIAIDTWPVLGIHQPDGIEAYSADGQTYLVTANEGDAREWGDYVEAARVKDLGTDDLAPICTDSPAAGLTADEQLGRLNVSIADGLVDDGDGGECYAELHSFGARSFSIFTADGQQVFDSGDEFERVVAEAIPEYFNSNHSESNLEGRSDDKGPEPESLDIGTVGDRTYAFIGFERVGGVIVYDITEPRDASYVTYVNNRDFSVSVEDADEPETVLDAAGDLGPEGIEFVAADDSPTGEALVAVGNEVSGTTTFYGLTDLTPGDAGEDGGGNDGGGNDGGGNDAQGSPEPERESAPGVEASAGSPLPDAGAPDLLILMLIGLGALAAGLLAMTERRREQGD
ncbi:choice-of-anchor I family protein [Aeromicrobium sp. CTD01-1L150]|uniref:choice-of-anchor I family protein n=1 Tax=Aeromicrobium sp. CTD01-1L150 TaxID=3341830 RepID=UPI0035C1F83F